MSDKFENRRIPYFGDFVLFDEIGRGGMGVVYDAQQSSLDRPVALKVLHSFAANTGAVQRLRIEAEAAARLDHPNIVPIFEIGEHDGHAYLAMQRVEGESLAERIARLGPNLNERDAALLLAKIARAVHHAHQRGVLHRDLKPNNILIDGGGEPHLIDFGLAKYLEQDAGITQTGAFLGTPAFASPEQATGQNKSITIASDIYSLGAILYTLLTRQPPFVGESPAETIELVKNIAPIRPRSVRPTLSSNIETICLKCLEKEPVRRYASALELAEDLDACLDGRPITARQIGALERFWMWTRRNPVHAGLLVALAIILVAIVIGISFWQKAQVGDRENEALIRLRSAASERLVGTPRKIGWRKRAAKYVSAASALADKPFYRDQISATCEGLDATLIAQRSMFLNEQILFDHAGETLILAGATNSESWSISSVTNRLNISEYPGRPIAYPKEYPVQVVRSPSGKLDVWQASQRRALCDLELQASLTVPEDEDGVLAAASSDGNILTLVLRDYKKADVAVFWRLPSGEIIRTVDVDSSVTALAVSADGSFAAYGNSEGQVRVWKVSTGEQSEPLSLSMFPIKSLAFAPSVRKGRARESERSRWFLAAGDDSGSIGIWNLANSRVQAVCRGAHYQVCSLAFSPDNMILASGGRGAVRLWDANTGTPLLDLDGDHCRALSFSPDGLRLAASAGHNATIRQIYVWELQNGRGITELRGLASSAMRVAFSPRGGRLAAIGIGWEVGVWDFKQKQLLHILETPRGVTADNFALAFNPDGRLLAISTGSEAQLWDVSTGRHLRSWKLRPGIGDTISFPKDDALFLLRVETLQGTEMPLANVPWQKHPRICRLRNLLAAEQPLKPISEISEFNVGLFWMSASADGQLFGLEGTNFTSDIGARSILVIKSSTGDTVWSTVSTNQAAWAINPFASTGAQIAFTTNGKEYFLKDLLATHDNFKPFPHPPAAIGPGRNTWAARGENTGVERGVSYFENDKLCLNLGLYSEMLLSPCFDSTGSWLAWGNADGTVSLCDLREVRVQLSRSGLVW